MNTLLKTLAAIALVAVIIAAGAHFYKSITGNDIPPNDPTPLTDGNPTPAPSPGDPTGPENKPEPTPPAPQNPEPGEPHTETVEVKPDDKIMPSYAPINSPVVLQNMRMKGKTYRSTITGTIQGRAQKTDWLIANVATNFNYVYQIISTAKIIENDGFTIKEERHFDAVSENLVVGDFDMTLTIPDNKITRGIGMLMGFDPHTTSAVIKEFNNSVCWTLPESELKDLAEWIPGINPETMKDKVLMFAKDKNHRPLAGKTVLIEFRDGEGIKKITPISGGGITDEEIEIIKRTNYIMDHYIMPEQQVAVGDEWKVDANVFSGLIDPRLRGAIQGDVTIMRVADMPDQNGNNRQLKLKKGQIEAVIPGEGNVVTGAITINSGKCTIPSKHGVIKRAAITGKVRYENVSTDHLLFEAKMQSEPKLEIKYECEVLDSED